MRERLGMIGSSPAFEVAIREAEKLAPTWLSVMLHGPTGTGKELLARFLHELSRRSDGPFVVANCGALPRDIFESDLFGHVKGAYTGALRDRVGLFERAHGGTIFLDEIGEMEPIVQVRFLRVLQEGEILPLGASQVRKVDVRVVAATHRNLGDLVVRGKFRRDLYYRLQNAAINLPPLCERDRDVIAIARRFLSRKFPGHVITSDGEQALLAYTWPGNIRELENVLGLCAVLSHGRKIDAVIIPTCIERLAVETQARRAKEQRRRRREEMKRQEVLDRGGGEPRLDIDRESAVLSLIEKRGAVTAADVRARLQLGKTTTKKLLAAMESQSYIDRRPMGPKTHYVMGKKPKPYQRKTRDADESRSPEAPCSMERQQEILRLLEKTASMTLREIHGKLSKAPTLRVLREELQRLKLLGLAKMDGHGRGARWSLVH